MARFGRGRRERRGAADGDIGGKRAWHFDSENAAGEEEREEGVAGQDGEGGGGQRADAGRGLFSEYETGPESAKRRPCLFSGKCQQAFEREVTSRFFTGSHSQSLKSTHRVP